MQFNNRPAPLTLRANPFLAAAADVRDELAAADVITEPGRWAPDALIVRSGHPLRQPGAASGRFVVQDEASQLVALLAGEQPGARVLDACASPGGKATAIAARLGDDDMLVACDVRDRRMDLLRQTIAATGASNVRVVQADLLAPLPFGPVFDCVIVDAPCSGLGTLRRDPDIRWRRHEADLTVLARGAAADARSRRRRSSRPAAASSTRRARANRKKTNRSPAASWLRGRSSGRCARLTPTRACRRRPWTRTAISAPSPDGHGLEVFFGAVFERARHL